MGFCSDSQYERFLAAVVPFERMLVESGLQLFKYYLDIDQVAVRHWRDYTKARDVMLSRTDHREGPWIVVRANDKERARLNVIADLVQRIECPDRDRHLTKPDRQIVFRYGRQHRGTLAR